MKLLTQDELKLQLHYDPETGLFTRNVSAHDGRWKKGKLSGGLSSQGYVVIRIHNILYLAHRLAFLFTLGFFPEYQIDHIDGDKLNNSWKNLREVSAVCNSRNTKIKSSNTSGFPGVSIDNRSGIRWYAYVHIGGKKKSLGLWSTALDAALARYNFEVVTKLWDCNSRSELHKAILAAWKDFNPKQKVEK